MITDYHTHTWRCGHGSGTLEEYVEAAIRAGIDEIGLTDHLYLYFLPEPDRDPRWAMPEADYRAHYEEMLAVRERYRNQIRVRVSVEADYIEGQEEALAAALSPFRFDYILGSVHFMDGWLMDDPDQQHRYGEQPIIEVYRRYYARLRKAASSGLFDLLGHLDLPKKFGHLPEESVDDVVGETLDTIAAKHVAVEINTSGLRKPVAEIYPARSILESMRKRDIAIALSSDAHAPSDVGAGYDEALELLRSCGYSEIVTFEQRVRTVHPLG